MKARRNAPVPALDQDTRALVQPSWHVYPHALRMNGLSAGWIDPRGRYFSLNQTQSHALFVLRYYGRPLRMPQDLRHPRSAHDYARQSAWYDAEYDLKEQLMQEGWVRVSNVSQYQGVTPITEEAGNTIAWLVAVSFLHDPELAQEPVYLDFPKYCLPVALRPRMTLGRIDRIRLIELLGTPELNTAMWEALDRKSPWQSFARQNRRVYAWR